jgi:hypothetical protein
MTALVTAPAPIWMLCIVGLLLWALLQPQAKEPYKVLALILVFLIEPISSAIMNAESRSFPLKFDYFLEAIDHSLGVTAFLVARQFSEWEKVFLFAIYKCLSAFMIIWYGVHLKMKAGRPRQLLIAYLLAYSTCPALYLIVPACGPRHAFPNVFPFGNPEVTPVLQSLHYWPNAIPSLHFATAFLFILFTARNRVMQTVGCVYLVGTTAATLAFEHYVIDLIVAIPFACFVASAADLKFRRALYQLGIVLAWLLLVRFATPTLIQHPDAVRLGASLTILLGTQAIRRAWSMVAVVRGVNGREAACHLPSEVAHCREIRSA